MAKKIIEGAQARKSLERGVDKLANIVKVVKRLATAHQHNVCDRSGLFASAVVAIDQI